MPARRSAGGGKALSFDSPARNPGRSAPHGCSRLVFSRLVYDVSAHNGVAHGCVLDFLRGDGEQIRIKNYDVRQFSRRDRSLFLFAEFRKSRAHGVGLDSFLQRELLLGEPAVGVFAVERCSRNGGVEAEHGIHGRDRPIASEGEANAVVEKRSKGVGCLSTLMADAFFLPAAVVDGMVRLHLSDDTELSETRGVIGPKILGVLDAPA